MLVRHTDDGRRKRSKTYHCHYGGGGRWLYQKLPPFKRERNDGSFETVPAVLDYLPSYEGTSKDGKTTIHST